MEGTMVNERIESLPSGKFVIRTVGHGWRPRNFFFEIIGEGNNRIKLDNLHDISYIRNHIAAFFANEKEDNE